MIDIKFLGPFPGIQPQSGMEFLDWQDKSFFNELTDFFKTHINEDNLILLQNEQKKKLDNIIKKHSNITVETTISDYGNAGIDAGYINPFNVLNIKDIEYFLKDSYSKIGETMTQLHTNLLKGWCDLKTGKVEGDFKKIIFNLSICYNLPQQIQRVKTINDVTLPEAMAEIVLHEVGHAFFGLHFITASVIDNVLGMGLVKAMVNQPDKNRKAVIIKNIKTFSEVDLSNALQNDDITPEGVLVNYQTGLKRRDSVRALSLGVERMTTEVLADAYSIRMGASHASVAVGIAFGINPSKQFYQNTLFNLLLGVLGIIIGIATSIFTNVLFGILAVGFILELYELVGSSVLVSKNYDTPYRRIKAVLRENINRLNLNAKSYSAAEYAKLKNTAIEIDRLVESQKSFWESTWVQRFIGYRYSKSDFRKNDFEHYTAELASSRLALHTTLS